MAWNRPADIQRCPTRLRTTPSASRTHRRRHLSEVKAAKLFTTQGDDTMVQWYKSNGFRPVALNAGDASALESGNGGAECEVPFRQRAHHRRQVQHAQRMRARGRVVALAFVGGANERQHILVESEDGAMNISPVQSPDGKYVAFFSRRGLFTVDLYLADAQTGEIIRELASPVNSPHFDAISFISSSGSWSPDSRKFAFIVFADGDNEINILDVESRRVERRLRAPGVEAVSHVAWAPDIPILLSLGIILATLVVTTVASLYASRNLSREELEARTGI